MEGLHQIKEQIGKYEIILLKQLNYNVPEEFPYDFIYVYSELLYPNNAQEIANFGIKIANDSYFTYANNIYKNYVVALSCIIIAAKFLDIPTILDENYKYIVNMKKIHKKNISVEEFNRALIQYDNQSLRMKDSIEEEDILEDDYFEKLSLTEKLYPNLKMEELLDCIIMITEFYEDMNEKDNIKMNGTK